MSQGNRSIPRSNVRHTATVELSFVSGASGAVPAMSAANMRRSRGIVSVTRNSAGNYTVVFERGCNDYIEFDSNVLQVAVPPVVSAATCGIIWKFNGLAASPSYTFQIINAAGIATDPSSGDIVNANIRVKYSNGYN